MISNARNKTAEVGGSPPQPSAPVINPRSSSSDFRPAPDPYEEAAKEDDAER